MKVNKIKRDVKCAECSCYPGVHTIRGPISDHGFKMPGGK